MSAGRCGQRFKSAAWNLTDDFAPRYAGGVARFDLAIEHRIRPAEHTILIAEVLEVASPPGAPLLHAPYSAYERLTMGRTVLAHGVLNWTKTDHWGYTDETGVMLKVVNGDWKVE